MSESRLQEVSDAPDGEWEPLQLRPSSEAKSEVVEISLDGWLVSTAELRQSILDYSRSQLSTDPGERQLDISKAISFGQDAGELVADLDKHIADETARAVLRVRSEFGDLNADERRAIVKSKLSGIVRLRDGIAVSLQSIKDRKYALMSVGRW